MILHRKYFHIGILKPYMCTHTRVMRAHAFSVRAFSYRLSSLKHPSR